MVQKTPVYRLHIRYESISATAASLFQEELAQSRIALTMAVRTGVESSTEPVAECNAIFNNGLFA